jgi:hypothetical protein
MPAEGVPMLAFGVALEHVRDVENRRPIVPLGIVRVLVNRRSRYPAPTRGVLIVQPLGPGVIGIETEPVLEPFFHRQLQRVIVRNGIVGVAVDTQVLRRSGGVKGASKTRRSEPLTARTALEAWRVGKGVPARCVSRGNGPPPHRTRTASWESPPGPVASSSTPWAFG